MTAFLRPTADGDVEAVVVDARPADVAEMAALGLGFEQALRTSVARSDWSATGVVDGRPVCVFGVAPLSLLNGVGAPWMLAARGLERARRPFLTHCPRVMAAMLATYPRLSNAVDERNTAAIRWLRWLGFSFDDARIPVGSTAFRVFRAGEW